VAVFPGPYRRYVDGSAAAAKTTRPNTGSATKRARAASTRAQVKYRVRSGDSLWTIARRHRVSVERLQKANDLRGSRVKPGQTLTIPAR
jgi:membrane-bound lytic murein transglycosylase D